MESTLFIHFHHAVCDGVGIFQFLHEILLEYAAAHGPVEQIPRLDFDRWERLRRGPFALPIAQQLTFAARQFMNLWAVPGFMQRLPSALLSHPAEPHDGAPAASDASFTGAVRLTSNETSALQQAARRLKVTVNDLLLCDLFLAIQEWRKSQESQRPKDWLRVAVPINLRTPDDHNVPASNILSMVFLDRSGLNFDDPGALLHGVSHEMKRHRKRHMSQLLRVALALGRRLPGGLKKHLWANKCLVSSMLSNLGRLFEYSPLQDGGGRLVVGDVTLQSVDALSPLRPHMQAAFVAGSYAGRLWITYHFDSRAMSRIQAQELMSAFHRRILASSAAAE